MDNELERAMTILREDGVTELSKRSLQYLRNYKSLHLAIYLCQGDRFLQKRTLREIRARMREEDDLDDILDTLLEIQNGYLNYRLLAAQLRKELKTFVQFVEERSPETIVEIGTHHGGTLYLWSRYLDSASVLISVDLPHFFSFVDTGRIELFQEFKSSADMHFIRDNSHKQRVFEEVAAQVDGVDFLFIDGDHTYQGVKQDFEMYSKLVSEGGLVAFHDIVPHAESKDAARRIVRENDVDNRYVTTGPAKWNVHQFWNEISDEYESWEFRSHPQQRGEGIGVIQV